MTDFHHIFQPVEQSAVEIKNQFDFSILNEWLLYPLKESEARDVLELVEARTKTASTIFCSQLDVPSWHENLYDPTLVDAICDRIVHDSYVIQIHGESMRKRKGILE